MKRRARLVLIAATLAALAALATAQEAPEDAPDAPQAATSPAAEPAPAAREKAAPRGGAGDERFVPSEDISEDLSVSFPSDI